MAKETINNGNYTEANQLVYLRWLCLGGCVGVLGYFPKDSCEEVV